MRGYENKYHNSFIKKESNSVNIVITVHLHHIHNMEIQTPLLSLKTIYQRPIMYLIQAHICFVCFFLNAMALTDKNKNLWNLQFVGKKS